MRLLSGFPRTKPLLISNIPDTPLIPFAAHYVQAAREQAFQRELPGLKKKIGGPTCDVAWSIEEVLGMEIWLKIFIEKQAGQGI